MSVHVADRKNSHQLLVLDNSCVYVKGVSTKEEVHVAINIVNENQQAFLPHVFLNGSTPKTLLTHSSLLVK